MLVAQVGEAEEQSQGEGGEGGAVAHPPPAAAVETPSEALGGIQSQAERQSTNAGIDVEENVADLAQTGLREPLHALFSTPAAVSQSSGSSRLDRSQERPSEGGPSCRRKAW